MVGKNPDRGPAPDVPDNFDAGTGAAPAGVLHDQPAPAPAAEEPVAARPGTHETAAAGGGQHPRGDRRAELAAGARSVLAWHGLRSTVVGVILAAVAVSLGIGSAVSVALLVAGVIFLVIGILGPRLQGRFAIEFGPNGASVDVRAHMVPLGSAWVARPLPPAQAPVSLAVSKGTDSRPALGSAAALLPEAAGARNETIAPSADRLQAIRGIPQNGTRPPA